MYQNITILEAKFTLNPLLKNFIEKRDHPIAIANGENIFKKIANLPKECTQFCGIVYCEILPFYCGNILIYCICIIMRGRTYGEI